MSSQNNSKPDLAADLKVDPKSDRILEAEGLLCPEPVMMIRKIIRTMQNGDVLLVRADDPSTRRDVPSFCQFMDHQLLSARTESKPFSYWIKKGL